MEKKKDKDKNWLAYLPCNVQDRVQCSTDYQKHFLSLIINPEGLRIFTLTFLPVEQKDPDAVAFLKSLFSSFSKYSFSKSNIFPFHCDRLNVENNRAFQSILHHGFDSTRSQGLPELKSNMAADFSGMFEFHERIWPFHMIQRPTTSWKVFSYHLQRCIVIPSYFTTTEVQNN